MKKPDPKLRHMLIAVKLHVHAFTTKLILESDILKIDNIEKILSASIRDHA
jgi:hypothetical protein